MRNSIIYLLIFLAVLGVLSPIVFLRTWPLTHDTSRYIVLLDHFRAAFLQGIIYPRWLPNLYGGYGYPTFLFYQPGFFYFALPFTFLPGYPENAIPLAVIFLFFLGTAGAYRLCKEISSDNMTALFCSLLFLLTPYLYVNFYVRGDLSELMAMLLCPWPLYFLIKLKKNIFSLKYTISLLAALSMVFISHPATALFFILVFCVFVIALFFDLPLASRKSFLINAAFVAIAAGILTSPYWFTIFKMKPYANIEVVTENYFLWERHFVSVPQLFLRYREFSASVPGRADVSFQLGAFHFLFALCGFVAMRRKKVIAVSFFLYLFLIFLMTPYSAPLWRCIPFMKFVQFPWRILSVTATLQVICACGIAALFSTSFSSGRKVSLMVMLLALMLLWYSPQFKISGTLDIDASLREAKIPEITRFDTYTAYNEFLPKAALGKTFLSSRFNTGMLSLSGSANCIPFKDNSEYRLHYQVKAASRVVARINQLYFPGWKVMVNGKTISSLFLEKNISEDPRIFFVLPGAGDYEIEAFYDGPPGHFKHNIINAFLMTVLGVVLVYYRRELSAKA